MSVQEPVQVVKQLWSRFATGGARAALAVCAADVVWTPHDTHGRSLRGAESILAHFGHLAADGIRVEAVAHRFENHPGCVVVAGRVRVLAPDGHYDIPMNWQVEVRDGLVTRVRAERRLDDAREDCAEPAAA
jgi:ketosteroid isomerase-like protein